MTKPTLTAPPAAPVRASPTFETDVGAFLTWMHNYQPELVTAIDWIETQLTSAQGAETTSTNKADEAAASATAAASSEAAAETAKSAAQAAQTGAQTANSQFQAIWCGSGAAAPTADGNGDPLSAGCLWFDTSANIMRSYNGSAWAAAAMDANGALVAVNNLSDLPDKASARANLGVPALASNLSDLPDPAAARSNLGITDRIVAEISHEEAAGVYGGDIGGGWQTRKLNVVNYDPQSIVTLSANTFAFSVAGRVHWSAPAYNSSYHQSRLVRVSDSAVIATGTQAHASSSERSTGVGSVEAGVAYRVEHQGSQSGSYGGGIDARGFSTKGVFTKVFFEK